MNEYSDNDNAIDRAFDAAMREYARRLHDGEDWPPEDVVERFVQNKATEEEIDRVHDTMITSASFMAFVANMQAVAGELERSESDADNAGVEVPNMPRVERVLGKESRPLSFHDRVTNLLDYIPIPPRARIPVAIAALLALLSIPTMRFMDQPTPISFARQDTMLPSAFIPSPHMGGSGSDRFENARAAAFAAFESRVQFHDSTWSIVEPLPGPGEAVPLKQISLEITDSSQSAIAKGTLTVPSSAWNAGKDQASIWLLAVPSLEVWNARAPDDKLKARVEIPPGDTLLFATVAIPEGTGWISSSVLIIEVGAAD